jgi:hypothetical protein
MIEPGDVDPRPVVDTDPGPGCDVGNRKVSAKKFPLCEPVVENLIKAV